MPVNRRSMIAATLGLGAAATVAKAGPSQDKKSLREAFQQVAHDIVPALQPNAVHDQTSILQAIIDDAAEKDMPVVLPSGVLRVSDLRLRAGTRLIGQARSTVLEFAGGAAFVTADKADRLVLRGVVFDGAFKAFEEGRGEGLVTISRSTGIRIDDIEIRNSARSGLQVIASSGRITGSDVRDALNVGIKSLDATGLEIRSNTVASCGNNGIQVWRSELGQDGTILTGNRITNIRHAAGGTGEYGNGINVFRAGSVLVQGNRISDCAYSAIRGNAASNIQILGNSCERLGEVAIYSEFGYEGALIANNLVDHAATGISVTNFKEGGRLAVIQGNLIRNLFRREQEKTDKRGEGIGVEADAAISGNTIEGAPTVGIQIGWGPYMRDVSATGNVIRRSRVGISITSARDAGACLIANNLISETKDGAIRAMDFGVVTGPDLAREPGAAGRVTVVGNVAV